jgi:hypothetical protein
VSTGPYMMTRSGRRFYFADPDPSEILLSDIDYALRHLNRFTGHVGPYSVATHSVSVMHCAQELGATDDECRAALLHDAHEAFVGDISSPLKLAMRAVLDEEWPGATWDPFSVIDEKAMRAIDIRFGLVRTELVAKADRMVTHAEALAFMGDAARCWVKDPWRGFDPNRRYSFSNACEEWGIT